jgi:uncharacterized protein DUF4252
MNKFMFLVVMLIAATASAQQLDLKALDKYADSAKSKTEINMDESMLKAAATSLSDKQKDEKIARKSVEGLKGFYLRAYEFNDTFVLNLEELKPLVDQLKAPDWKPLLRNKEAKEQTEIWMHYTNGMADGMVLIAAEPHELTVINGIGVTNLNDLKALGKMDPLK